MKKKLFKEAMPIVGQIERFVCPYHIFSLSCRIKLLVMMKQCLLMKTSVRLLNMASRRQLAGVWE